MALDIESIEARANAATPGPWVRIGDSIGADVKKCTCGVPRSVYGHESGCGIDGPLITGAAIPDAEFIAAAREDVPALVAEVERLRAIEVEALDATREFGDVLARAERAEAEVKRLRAQRDAVLALHYAKTEFGHSGEWLVCAGCMKLWPCPTARALGVTE